MPAWLIVSTVWYTFWLSLASAWIAPPARAFTFYLASGGATTGDQAVAAKALVGAFKKDHPESELELDVSTSYLRGVTETLMQNFGDKTPDVAIVGLDAWPILAKHKMLRSLTTVLTKEELAGIWKKLLPIATVQTYGNIADSRSYALPFNRGTPVLYINGALLHQTGLGDTTPTWSELGRDLETAQASQRENRQWMHVSIPLDDWVTEGILVGATGTPTLDGARSNFSAAPIRLLVGQLRQMREATVLSLVESQHAAYEEFAAGHAAAALFSASAIGGLLERVKFETRVVPLPYGGKHAVNVGGGDLVLPANPSHPISEKARNDIRQFVLWFYSGDGGALWAARASMAPLTKAATDAAAAKTPRVLRNADKLSLTSFYRLNEYCGILKVRQAATRAFGNALNGADSDAALNQADDYLSKLLAAPDCP